MTVAVLGWGSLIWCPGILRITTRWQSDGPSLPIEFARISEDGRLTLVIQPSAENQTVYWAVSEFGEVAKARCNLQAREGTIPRHVHYLATDGTCAKDVLEQVRESVQVWLRVHEDVGAVIWTGLPTNWPNKRGCDFTPEDAVRYLEELESDRNRAVSTFVRAQEYVKNTPPQIKTKVRRAMQERDWQDNEVSRILFEE